MFQLGFVNLPSAKIKGFEGDFAFTLSDEWQLDGTFSRNTTATEAAAFVVNGDPTPENPTASTTFAVEKGARLPLTPDWLGLARPRVPVERELLNAEPFARFDYSYVGNSVNALEGIEAVVSSVLVATSMPTRPAICVSGWRATLERLDLRRQPVGRARRTRSSEQSLERRSGCRSTGRAP